MKRERLAYLLDRYEKGLCSVAEQAELDDLYHSLGSDEGQELPAHIQVNIKEYISQRYKKLKEIIDNQEVEVKKKDRTIFYKIAAVVLLIVTTGLIYSHFQRRFSHVTKLPAVVSYDAMADRLTDSRYIRLPDSSVAVLRAGSSLKVDTVDFNGATRSVVLNGEGYFDIHHDESKPFIVKAGALKITVLGTAFNIREKGDSVAVTVTRGKVRVEAADKTIAVLTPNQEVIYAKQQAVQKPVGSDDAINWVRAGLQFDGEPLAQIAEKLQARYGIKIQLSGEKLGACKIAVTNAFAGTETAEEILSFICPIIGATYTQNGDSFMISGAGCNE